MTVTSESELAAAIRDATGPLRIQGGGTRPIGRPVVGEVLSTRGLTGITLYDPGALTIVVKTGTPVEEVEAALAKEGQRLAFEPMDHRMLLGTDGTPTIGGVVAGNISGPRRIAVGACRDFMLGVTFVDGSGTLVKNGGRVMKNVTGYDLVKLMCGSYGTLGVMTEVALKVLPVASAETTLTITGLDPDQAVGAMSAALGSPFDVNGVAHDGQDTLFRLEGFSESVTYRTAELTKHLAPFGTATPIDDSAARWRAIRDVDVLAGASGDIWRLSVKPTDAPGILEAIKPSAALLDWGGGLIWLAIPPGTDVRSAIAQGHATLIRGTTHGPAFHPEPAPVAAITQGLRDRFDPRGILNPGLMT
ncbi:glycolate oxidase subunit GlcE [Yoonia sp. R2331]|uniref:glycolate oxidase subunit GlcE n=1 Tax=Yoonia sp. R2331 TaxID=3237238 RepID=UPI0034E4CAD7